MTDIITDLYRAIVADAGAEGITRREALDQLVEQVIPLWKSGDVELDPADLIRQAGRAVDESDGHRADDALAQIAAGADDLSLDADPLLDCVVTLGRGRRKTWRWIVAADLLEMDANRFGNVVAVTRNYREKWKPQIDAWLPVLMRHPTIGAAVEAEDLPQIDAGLFELPA